MPSPLAPSTVEALQLAFDLSPVGMCVTEDRVVTLCNQAFGEMFGYGEGELHGKPLAPLYPSQVLLAPVRAQKRRYQLQPRRVTHRYRKLTCCLSGVSGAGPAGSRAPLFILPRQCEWFRTGADIAQPEGVLILPMLMVG